MRAFVTSAALFGLLGAVPVIPAQELAPRAYWPAPVGTNVLVSSYQRSEGDVVTDPALPIDDAEVTLDFLSVTWQRTFGLFGRTTNLQLNLPYVIGHGEAFSNGEFRERDISSLTDARARISINLVGAPAMDPAAFRQLVADPGPILGISVMVSTPTGGYDADRLFNAGSNRWAVKPAVGGILPFGNGWFLEGEVGAWYYGDNDDFLGQARKQDTLFSSEIHLLKSTRLGTWVSLDANWYSGGEVTVGDAPPQPGLANSRAGITFLHPFSLKHALRIQLNTAIETKSGGDYDSATISYMYIWR